MLKPGTPSGERFPRWCRLIHRNEYHRAFREGRRISLPGIKIVVAPNELGRARLGLAVSRKVGNAVVRNRMKRRLREIFRRQRHLFPHPIDIVVVPYAGSARFSFEELKDKLLLGIRKGCDRLFGAPQDLPPRDSSPRSKPPG